MSHSMAYGSKSDKYITLEDTFVFLANILAIHIQKQDTLAERKNLNVSLADHEAVNFQFPISIYSDMK